jgi:tryptophan-rich sensory protein
MRRKSLDDIPGPALIAVVALFTTAALASMLLMPSLLWLFGPAIFIFFVVRLLNQRDDPHDGKHPPDPP